MIFSIILGSWDICKIASHAIYTPRNTIFQMAQLAWKTGSTMNMKVYHKDFMNTKHICFRQTRLKKCTRIVRKLNGD